MVLFRNLRVKTQRHYKEGGLTDLLLKTLKPNRSVVFEPDECKDDLEDVHDAGNHQQIELSELHRFGDGPWSLSRGQENGRENQI